MQSHHYSERTFKEDHFLLASSPLRSHQLWIDAPFAGWIGAHKRQHNQSADFGGGVRLWEEMEKNVLWRSDIGDELRRMKKCGEWRQRWKEKARLKKDTFFSITWCTLQKSNEYFS